MELLQRHFSFCLLEGLESYIQNNTLSMSFKYVLGYLKSLVNINILNYYNWGEQVVHVFWGYQSQLTQQMTPWTLLPVSRMSPWTRSWICVTLHEQGGGGQGKKSDCMSFMLTAQWALLREMLWVILDGRLGYYLGFGNSFKLFVCLCVFMI